MAFKISNILNPAPSPGRGSSAEPTASSNTADLDLQSQNGISLNATAASRTDDGSDPKSQTDIQTHGQRLSQTSSIEPANIKHSSSDSQSHPASSSTITPGLKSAVLDIVSSSSDSPAQSDPSPSLPLFIPAKPLHSLETNNLNSKTTSKLKTSSVPRESSPLVKNEEPDTPDEMAIDAETIKEIKDEATRTAVEALINEHGLRGARKSSEQKSTPEPIPAPKKSKKTATAATKKGTAKKPSSKKKPRPVRAGSPPKTTKLTPKKETSATPARSSSPAVPDEDEEISGDDDMDGSDDDQLYCICRKPDDHKYMIGCDGGCDNWFHGKCVNITENDGKLIDKYICPNCERKGIGITTWKPMCRRLGCRKPALVLADPPSKYCSEDCGVRFFQEIITKSEKQTQEFKGKAKPGKRKYEDDGTSVQRGCPLLPGILKTLVQHVSTVEQFRNLGRNILSKVPADINAALQAPVDIADNHILTHAERAELRRTTERKERLRLQRGFLKDRERFITLVKDQHAAHAEREGIKPKDVCGYDTRLAWSAEEFERWKAGSEGQSAFEHNTLAPPTSLTNGVSTSDEKDDKPATETDADGDVSMADDAPHSTQAQKVNGQASKYSICTRKRCERHKAWARLALEEVRYDESSLADQMRETERVERQVRETALLRWREEQAYQLESNGTIITAEV